MTSIKRQVLTAKIRRKTGGATKKLLEALFDVVNATGSLAYSTSKYSYFSSLRQGVFSKWSSERKSKKFYELRRNGYIRYDSNNDSIELTNKARINIIDKISSDIKKDNKLRFISFDIPETKKMLRNSFRRAIKRIGFCQIQKSLWAINKNVGELVEQICSEYKVEKYVTYIIAENTDINEHIIGVLNRNK